MSEQLVVLPFADDSSDAVEGDLVHLPGVKVVENGNGDWHPVKRISIESVKWPHRWPTVCGRDGLVYARAGVLAGRPVCPDCEAA